MAVWATSGFINPPIQLVPFMIFVHPERFWLLWFAPLLAAWIVLGQRRRRLDWAALAQRGRPGGDGSWGSLAGMACLVLALAQPRWGRLASPPLPPGHDVVLAVDVSRSMGAEDAVPNRLGVAVEAAESLVKALGGERGTRVGVVAFAGRGVLRSPLTENLGAVIEVLQSLRPGAVRPGGTDLGDALDVAALAFDDQEHAEGRAIVLFSDGEDHLGTWPARLEPLREAGVVVHSVAIGDPERGHPVPLGGVNKSGFIKFQGEPVLSKRSDAAFDALAHATGGAVVRLGLAAADLGSLYRTRIEPVARVARAGGRPPERSERFGLFVIAALVLGLAGGGWRGQLDSWRVGLTLLAALPMLGAGTVESAAELVERGRAASQAGRFSEALAAFEQAVALDPSGPVPRYNAAATLFRIERYPEALARYTEARSQADHRLRIKIDYALGNTALALGGRDEAIRFYDACLASTATGEELDAVRADAAVNREFAVHAAPRRPSSAPPEGEKDRGNRPAPRPKPPPGSNAKPDPSKSLPPGAIPPPGDDPASQHRGPGGAGGDATDPRPGSPEARLAEALDNIREAKRGRLGDQVPGEDEGDDRKDW